MPSSSSSIKQQQQQQSLPSSIMIDDRLWIYWQLPNDHFVLTINSNGKLLRIPLKRLDQFRKLRKKLSESSSLSKNADHNNNNRLFDDEIADLLDMDSDDDEDSKKENVNDDDDEQRPNNVNDYRRITLASNDVRSKLTIIPRSSEDFGVYQCWAENFFGSNRHEPCLFNLTNNGNFNDIDNKQILKTFDNNHHQKSSSSSQWKNTAMSKNKPKLPRSVTNCTTTFLITSLLSIRCEHLNYSTFHRKMFGIGNDDDDNDDDDNDDIADRNLKFHLILKELSNYNRNRSENLITDIKIRPPQTKNIITANQTNPIEPIFLISNVRPTFIYEAIIYVSNDFGYSDQVSFCNF